MVPIQRCLELDPSRDGPSTSFPYLCWLLAQTGDECADWVVSFINPPRVGGSWYTGRVGSTQQRQPSQ